MELTDLSKRIANYLDINENNLFLPNKDKIFVDGRQVLSIIAQYYGYGVKEIGKYLNRDHSSIVHLTNKRMVTERALNCINYILKHEQKNKVEFYASRVAKNPDDQQSLYELKELLDVYCH